MDEILKVRPGGIRFPESLAKVEDVPEKFTSLENDYKIFKNFIRKYY